MFVGDAGPGGTNWYGMSMEDIQRLANSPDLGLQGQIADGWSKSADLLAMHLGEVQNYRNALAEAWPPNKSKAADAYLTKLDVMIDSLTETFNATIANGQALQTVNASLAEAQTQVNQLHAQWQANNQALAAFTQKQQQQQASGQPTPSPSPSGDEPPLVTAAQQDALKLQAVKIMSKVSTDLSQAQLQLVTPDVFDPTTILVEKGGRANGAEFPAPPVLPPIVPLSSGSGGGGSSSRGTSGPGRAGASSSATSSANGPNVGAGNLPGGNGGHPNLVLGGANPPSLTPPPITDPHPGLITTLPNPGTGPIVNPGLFPPGAGPFPAAGGSLPTRGGGGFPEKGGLSGENRVFRPVAGDVPEGGLRAMPPGGLIGQPPAAPGEPIAARFGTQRINPVGGVIEPGGSGARAVGGFGGEGMIGGPGGMTGARGSNVGSSARPVARGAASEQPYGQLGGRRNGRRDEKEQRQWDPDNPWATEIGVDPVVLPAAEQRVDPGPAIGLR